MLQSRLHYSLNYSLGFAKSGFHQLSYVVYWVGLLRVTDNPPGFQIDLVKVESVFSQVWAKGILDAPRAYFTLDKLSIPIVLPHSAPSYQFPHYSVLLTWVLNTLAYHGSSLINITKPH